MYLFFCEIVDTDDTNKKGRVMDAKKKKEPPPKPIRWDDAEWAWLAEVAKSVGLNRSSFIRFATLSMARATTAGLPAYSVGVAIATPQNTRPNQITNHIAQQGGSEIGGGGSRSRSKPEAFSGPIPEELERKGGVNPTNGAKPKAVQAKVLRS